MQVINIATTKHLLTIKIDKFNHILGSFQLVF